ncbi:MAG: hypothetical protein WDZ52_11810 [Pseudohongiellaceae bacterium]
MTSQVSLGTGASTRPKLLILILRPILVLLLSAPVIVMLLSLETSPSLVTEQAIAPAELQHIESLLLESTPEMPASAGLQELKLNSEELNLLLRYAAHVMNLSSDWAASAVLNDAAMRAELSVRISQSPLPLYLNVEADLVENDNLLRLDALRVGKIGIPDKFLQFTLQRIESELASNNIAFSDFSELIDNVERVELTDNQMAVSLQWDANLISRIGNQAQQLFISAEDKQRIIDYYEIITHTAAAVPSDIRAVSINAFLMPMFAAAQQKSLAGSDPIAENRTAFQALAIYINQVSLAQLVGSEAAAQIEPAPFIEARLHRRQDLAQHLVTIAAITASAGADIAQMLSTTKEAYDARYRSGFSFSDLTANSVGVTLGELASSNHATARIIQQRLAALSSESDYMPEVGSNRDGLSETDFNAIYQDRSGPEYQERLVEISTIIDSRPLFAGLLPQ